MARQDSAGLEALGSLRYVEGSVDAPTSPRRPCRISSFSARMDSPMLSAVCEWKAVSELIFTLSFYVSGNSFDQPGSERRVARGADGRNFPSPGRG